MTLAIKAEVSLASRSVFLALNIQVKKESQNRPKVTAEQKCAIIKGRMKPGL
jgi:hypothetical protein